MANNLQPLLRGQSAIKEAEMRRNEAQGARTQRQIQEAGNSANPGIAPQQNQPNERQQNPKGMKGIVTPESIKALQKPIIRSTPEEIRNRASELTQQYPQQFPTLEAGIAEAEKEDATRVSNETSELSAAHNQTALRTKLEEEFDKRIGKKLQKSGEGIYQDLPGDYLSKLLLQADDDVAKDKRTLNEAANHYGDQALAFAESRQNLKTLGGKTKFLDKTPSATKKSLDALRKTYKDNDELKTFEKDLQSFHGLTPYYSSYIARPPSENRQINNMISYIKPKNIKDIREGKQTTETNLAEKIGKNLTKEDSLLSIALALHGKGYDEGAFLDKISDDYKSGKLSLSQPQGKELENRTKVNPSFGDLFLFAFSGLDKLVEQK